DLIEEPGKQHPSRPRRKYRGELIQMDASQLVWFGEIETHLHVAVDDASGDIVGAYFDYQETLKGYFNVLNQILVKHGIPMEFLTDRRTVFEYQSKKMKKVEEHTLTQFGFACQQLGIDLDTTSIAEKKGRVERLNQTLQSRLAVDLQRKGIQSLEEANSFLEEWIQTF
ncbi:transposase family protein, partial [Streptococcus mitis]|nr:transposase family protein [Streptococcus sp. NLN76]